MDDSRAQTPLKHYQEIDLNRIRVVRPGFKSRAPDHRARTKLPLFESANKKRPWNGGFSSTLTSSAPLISTLLSMCAFRRPLVRDLRLTFSRRVRRLSSQWRP